MDTSKYLEYYLDSKIYSNDEVQKSIDETKKEFPNKNIKVNVSLNEFGVYVVTLEFENKNTFFNRIKIKFRKKQKNKLLIEEEKINKNLVNMSEKNIKIKKTKEQRKQEKIQKRFDRYSGNNNYGKYKSTGIYHPY